MSKKNGGFREKTSTTHNKSNNPFTVLTAWVLVMFMAGMPLMAGERRGATVEVTMADGSKVRGELLAVKSDALLLFDRTADQGKSLDLRQVTRVKICGKSMALQGAAIGLGIGLVTCLLNNAKYHSEDAALAYLLVPPPAALLGGVIGGIAGMSETFSLPGESSQSLRQNLERLKRYARQSELEKPGAALFTEDMAFNHDTKNHKAKRLRRFRHRFRFLWSPGKRKISANNDFSGKNGSFRFGNQFSSKDTAVYPFELDSEFYDFPAQWKIGQLRLEYELTPHFSSSLEFVPSGKSQGWIRGNFSFYSADYAKQCESLHYIHTDYSQNSLLLGLNWKPFTPSFARKHSIELGIAAGPTQVQVKYWNNLNSYQKFKASTWSCNVHAAYDYFRTEDFSLGVFAEYQHLRASFSSVTFSCDSVSFHLKRDSFIYGFTRPTEVTLPGHNLKYCGKTYGLRIGLRF